MNKRPYSFIFCVIVAFSMLKVFNAFSGHSRYFLFGVNRASFHLQRTPLRGFARIRTARGAAAFPSDALPIDDSQKVRIVDEGSEKYKIIELNSQQAEEFDRMLGMPSPGVKRATKKTGAKDTPHKSASKDLSFAFKSRPAATPSDLGEAVAEMASSRGSTSWDGGSGNSEEEWKKIKGFLELNPYICHGCGAPFQSKTPDAPGFLPKEKMAPHRVNAEAIRKEQDTIKLIRDAGYEVGSDAANNLLLNANTPTEVIDRISQRFSKSRKGNSSAVSAVSVPEEVVDIRAAKSQYKEDIGDVACTCQRCFRLQQYGQIEDSLRPGWSENELLTPEHFESVLKVINQTKAVVVCLVDIFDLKGSILTNLKQIAGKNPIVIAANKVDLLPSDVSKVRIRDRIYDMIREECDLMSPKEAEEKKYHAMKQRGWIRPNELKSEAYVLYRQNVHLVSCESGVGMNELMKGIFSLAQDHGNKIYVMGAANVGKSSFINRILNMNVGGRGGSGNKKAQKPVSIRDKWEPTATVSNLPGTTLNFLKIVMHNGITVFDTPGLMNKGQLTALLTAKELNDVIPDKPVHPVTLRLDEGRCALIGGIAKIEMIQGRTFCFTFFVSNSVTLHPTDSMKAASFIEKHVGTLASPPHTIERLKALGEPTEHVIKVHGDGWEVASTDIVIAGLGWVSVTGVGDCVVNVTVPGCTSVTTRPALLPFESRRSGVKFTGSRLIRKTGKGMSLGWRK